MDINANRKVRGGIRVQFLPCNSTCKPLPTLLYLVLNYRVTWWLLTSQTFHGPTGIKMERSEKGLLYNAVGKCTGRSENFSPRLGYLRRGMVCWRRWEDNELFYSSLSSPVVRFLVQGFEVVQGTSHPPNLPFKKVTSPWHPCHFPSMYNVLSHKDSCRPRGRRGRLRGWHFGKGL